MKRKKHPKPAIEHALQYAESQNWRIEESNSHAHGWGKMYCSQDDKDCRCGEFCKNSIWSTPKNVDNHAKQIKRYVDNCKYSKADKNEDNS